MAKPKTEAKAPSMDRSPGQEVGEPAGKQAGKGSPNNENNARQTPDLDRVFREAAQFRTTGPDPDSESLRKLREVVWRMLPLGASVLVVSKGDQRLLTLYGPEASHFPQDADGAYSGYYPADGTAVISHLEALRTQGAEYLIFPSSALWWLESYPKFAAYLRLHYRLVVHDPSACAIFALKKAAGRDRSAWRAALLQVVEERAAETGTEPSILDWNTGLDLKGVLSNRAIFSPPTKDSVPPYVDRSVDVVVFLSPDDEALAKGRRVAAHAVVTLRPFVPDNDGDATNDLVEELRAEVELVNGSSNRTSLTISIVIQAHSRWEQLGRCLGSLEETLPDPFDGEVIVVDDAAGDETNTVLHEWEGLESRLRLKVLQNSANRGYLESRNRGAAEATGEIVVFLDERTLPQFGWLSALHSVFSKEPTTGAVTGRLLYRDGRLREAGNIIYSDASTASIGSGQYAPDAPLYSFVREVDFCSPALFATRRKVFEEIGGFSGPPGFENIDYCFALRDLGYKVQYQPECTAVQLESSTSGELLDGTAKYQEANRAKFVKKWETALGQQIGAPTERSREAVDYQGTKRAVGRAVVCAPLLPEFDREGGSRRIYSLIEFLREDGWDVSFVSENPHGDDRYVRILQQEGVAVYRGFGPHTDDLLKFGGLDVVFFAFWHLAEDYMDKLREMSPDTKIMIDVIDLHWLRNARKYFLQLARDSGSSFVQESGARSSSESNPDFSAEMLRELKTYLQSDAVLTPSDKEAEMIGDLLGNWSLAHTLRSYEPSIASPVPLQDRKGILFLANFNHPPNIDAITYFCGEILPRIDRNMLGEHPVSIVGQNPPPVVLDYAKSSPYVHVFGWVPSVIPYLQRARLTVVPMRYGAGTKTKLLQALMAHTPTVTTSIGVEGLNIVPGRHVLLADDAASFAAATERLLSDSELWASIRDSGGEVTSRHSRQAVREQLMEVLEAKVSRAA
jgi:GT2 family glycosyltransferase/glycosyltransferase involved in cell wall biosynthesis